MVKTKQTLFLAMLTSSDKKLFVIDTMALIYRAHFALHRYTRTNSRGMDVGALLGFANSLVEVLQKQSPTHVVAAFDTPAPTWRKVLYKPYKAQRQIQPEAITKAIPYIKAFLEAFGIPYLAKEGYEADDIIGTLVTQAVQEGFDIYMVSPDKDLGQLVQAHVWWYKPASGHKPALCWGMQEILTHWGIDRPTQIPDILGLQGDSSDNIPGVPGIGPKTAQKLIAACGTLERVIAQKEALTPALQATLEKYQAQAMLSKKLATIVRDLTLNLDLSTSGYQGPDTDLLKPLLEELEFRTLAKRLLGEGSKKTSMLSLFESKEGVAINTTTPFATLATTQVCYQCLGTLQSIQEMVQEVAQQTHFAFDTETTGLNPHTARLLGVSISYEANKAYFIPIPASAKEVQARLASLTPLWTCSKKRKIGQNLKYDLLVLRQYGIQVTGPFFDTMIAHHLIAPDRRHNLTALARTYLQYTPIEIEALIGEKGASQKRLDQVPLEKLVHYACEDADITLQLYHKLAPILTQEELTKLFYEVEMKLLPVLVGMEYKGIAVDKGTLKQISLSLNKEIQALEKRIYQLATCTFNISSPKQLGTILFDKLRILEKPLRTQNGQYATNEAVLNKLIQKHAIIPEVVLYREIKKLKSTYVDALPALLGKDGRIHTSYQQGLVSTGRLSSVHPNLQNIPIRTERGRAIRKAFVPGSTDTYLLSADYAQIELRIMAHFSQDKQMIAALEAEQDIHTMTASKIFQVAETEVTPVMRRQAKMVNFGIIYGISAFGLSQRLQIPRTKAAAIIKAYFEEFTAVKTYIHRVIAETRTKGYVQTLLGRRRFLPAITSRNATMRGLAERNAINMPIQGTAAELIQCAMIDIQAWLDQTKLPASMVLQVHDELVFEVHESALTELKTHIPKLMQEALPLQVPIRVHVGTGEHWLAAH